MRLLHSLWIGITTVFTAVGAIAIEPFFFNAQAEQIAYYVGVALYAFLGFMAAGTYALGDRLNAKRDSPDRP